MWKNTVQSCTQILVVGLFFSRSCWLLIWPWIVKTHKQIFGIEYVGMNTWHMRFRNATIVLKSSYIL